jgi:hypothetical protein
MLTTSEQFFGGEPHEPPRILGMDILYRTRKSRAGGRRQHSFALRVEPKWKIPSSLSDLVEHNRFGDDRRRSGL